MNWDIEGLEKLIESGKVKVNENSIFKPEDINKTKKKSKYNNKRTTIDGIKFDSKKEADYYCELKILKRAGEIKDFGMQEKFLLQEPFDKNGEHYRPISYYADFVVSHLDGTTEVIDVKADEHYKTQVYKIKKKLFEYRYPDLTIKEVY